MKREVAEYVALCDICHRVKAEHQRPAGLLQPLNIPEWKWEEIAYHPQTDGQTERTNQILEDMTPLHWDQPCKKEMFGPEIIEDAEWQVWIVDRKGEVAYQLELPDRISGVHDVFHVSELKKCLRVSEEHLQMDDLNVQDDLTYIEYPVQILETTERATRKRVIKMCKVKWSHHFAEEAT
ncbi:hypothetical protein U9M48_011619 [Paspalum notatum var. saurae]|uniref:Tf2-1-like SH3-like domain-containing protein n=1 Tax=Paspalum notatum var. saurae TaxID=547442 RepID=A0AAQ3SVU0_PASNO